MKTSELSRFILCRVRYLEKEKEGKNWEAEGVILSVEPGNEFAKLYVERVLWQDKNAVSPAAGETFRGKAENFHLPRDMGM